MYTYTYVHVHIYTMYIHVHVHTYVCCIIYIYMYDTPFVSFVSSWEVTGWTPSLQERDHTEKYCHTYK